MNISTTSIGNRPAGEAKRKENCGGLRSLLDGKKQCGPSSGTGKGPKPKNAKPGSALREIGLYVARERVAKKGENVTSISSTKTNSTFLVKRLSASCRQNLHGFSHPDGRQCTRSFQTPSRKGGGYLGHSLSNIFQMVRGGGWAYGSTGKKRILQR